MLLSALDFPFCFAAVRYLGTDRIGHYEHMIVEWAKSAVPEGVAARYRQMRGRIRGAADEIGESGALSVGGVAGEEAKVEAYGVVTGESEIGVMPGYDHGVKAAEKMNKSENASESLLLGGFRVDKRWPRACTDKYIRYLDAAGLSVRHT